MNTHLRWLRSRVKLWTLQSGIVVHTWDVHWLYISRIQSIRRWPVGVRSRPRIRAELRVLCDHVMVYIRPFPLWRTKSHALERNGSDVRAVGLQFEDMNQKWWNIPCLTSCKPAFSINHHDIDDGSWTPSSPCSLPFKHHVASSIINNHQFTIDYHDQQPSYTGHIPIK